MLAYTIIILNKIYMKKGVKKMYIHAENNVTLILSVVYSLKPDTASKIVESRGDAEAQKKIVQHEFNKFFNDTYPLVLKMALKYAQGNSVRNISKEYNVSEDTVRNNIRKVDTYYEEFKGFVELGLVRYSDNPNLLPFFAQYGKYYKKAEEKRAEEYRLFQAYKNGKITAKKLSELTHKTPKTLCDI